MNTFEEAMKLFAISNQLAENDLDRIEREFAVDLGRAHTAALEKDETYYPQIERQIRQEAASMSQHYEIIYSLEKTIRSLVADTLQTAEGDTWWNAGRVPIKIKADAEARLQREIDSGMTVRSSDPLDFTTFGELGEIIKGNWDIFGSLFTSPKAVERVMANLNTLRAPIAHCSVLAEDEIVRLRLSVRDWFRLFRMTFLTDSTLCIPGRLFESLNGQLELQYQRSPHLYNHRRIGRGRNRTYRIS